jgi:hypothetical protein
MAFLSPGKITTMDEARKHRTYALWILIIVYIFNFIDRQIVNILQEDIKHELNLQDWQLGMMTGLTFAVVYCTAGIPVARLADSSSRKGVMVVSLAIWSAVHRRLRSRHRHQHRRHDRRLRLRLPARSPAWASASAKRAAARPPTP